MPSINLKDIDSWGYCCSIYRSRSIIMKINHQVKVNYNEDPSSDQGQLNIQVTSRKIYSDAFTTAPHQLSTPRHVTPSNSSFA